MNLNFVVEFNISIVLIHLLNKIKVLSFDEQRLLKLYWL